MAPSPHDLGARDGAAVVDDREDLIEHAAQASEVHGRFDVDQGVAGAEDGRPDGAEHDWD